MNYWNFSPSDLESIVFRRTAGTGFEQIPGNFQNSASQAQSSNLDNSVMQHQIRPAPNPHQSGGSSVETSTSVCHRQNQQQQQQLQPQSQQIRQQNQLRQAKAEPGNRQQQAAPAGALNLQMARFPSVCANGFLPAFSATNSQANNANPVVASVTGMLLSTLPSVVTVPNSLLASSSVAPNAAPVAKSKKKKKKSPAPLMSPSMTIQKIPAPRAQCLLCERNYGNRRDLRRHVLAHHEGVRFMCRLCSKIMMSSKSVRAHLKSSAHRLANDNEITMNIEKMTPGIPPPSMVAGPFNVSNTGPSGVTTATTIANKKEGET